MFSKCLERFSNGDWMHAKIVQKGVSALYNVGKAYIIGARALCIFKCFTIFVLIIFYYVVII